MSLIRQLARVLPTVRIPTEGLRWATSALIAVAALALMLWPTGSDEQARISSGAGLAVLLIGFFVHRGIPDYIAALAFFAVAVTVAAVPPEIVFAGFNSGGTWLIFGGMILATALKNSGLAEQIAARLLPAPGTSYWIAISSIVIVSLLFVVVVPSIVARVLLLVPIAMAFAEQLGYRSGSRATMGIVLAATVTTYYGAAGVLTAALTNVVMVSLADTLYGEKINYGQYFIAAFPLLTAGAGLLVIACISIFFREPPESTEARHSTPTTQNGNRQLALILVVAVALWATDSVHGIAPAWIALSAGALCLMGPARNLTLSDCVKIDAWIIFAAFLSLGAVLDHLGSAQWIGQWLMDYAPLSHGADWTNLAVVTGMGVLLSIGATNLAQPILYTSLAEPISLATGWPLEAVLLVGIPTWTIIPFAFLAPIMIIGMKLAGIPILNLSRFFLAFAALSMVTLVPLHFLWLKFLGYFG